MRLRSPPPYPFPASVPLLHPLRSSPSMKTRPCGQTLDNRDNVVAFEFANTSALGDLCAFEYRRLNSRNSGKHTKKDRARERDEIECSWDLPGKSITPNLDQGLSHAPAILVRLSHSQAHLTVRGARGSAAASPYSHSQSGAESFVKPGQPNNSASALVKSTQPSSSTGGPADQQRHLRRSATIHPGPGPCQSPMDPMASVNTSHDAGAD